MATAAAPAPAAPEPSTLPYTTTWLTGPHSTSFHTRTYLPPPSAPTHAVVIYIHGFAEHVGRYTHFHPLLSQKGIAVFAFDQRGFGLTALDTEGKKSAGSAWGKTGWREQMEDVDWAVGYVREKFEGVPVFLVGHSMGGGETLGFVSQPPTSPSASSVSHLSGAIATSPLITQTTPAPKVAKWIGGKASVLLPNTVIPAPVKAEDLSHDAAFNAAYLADPLIKQSGTLRGLSDMLSQGEKLLKYGCRRWPAGVPLLIVHGTADRVTNHKSSETFVNSLPAGCNGKLSLVEGGFHELQNEPDGVKERLADEIVAFVMEHIPAGSPPGAVAEGSSSAAAKTEAVETEDGAKGAPAEGKAEESAKAEGKEDKGEEEAQVKANL